MVFYKNYSRLSEESFAEAFGVEFFECKKTVDLHRAKYYDAGERAYNECRIFFLKRRYNKTPQTLVVRGVLFSYANQ